MDHNTTKMYIEYRYPKDIFPNLCHKNGKAINNSMNTRGAKEGMDRYIDKTRFWIPVMKIQVLLN